MLVRVALTLLVGAAALAAGFYGRDIVEVVSKGNKFAMASRSPEAGAALEYLSTFKPKDVKAFCGPIVIDYDPGDMFSDTPKRRDLLLLKRFQDAGYLAEDKTPREFNWQNLTKGRAVFLPTDKLLTLGTRKEGDCYHYTTGEIADVKIVSEDKHPQYKQVTVVSAAYEYERESGYEKFLNAGMYATKSRKVRMLFVNDPYEGNKPMLKRFDWAERTGPFLTSNVPNALAEINMVGPEKLR